MRHILLASVAVSTMARAFMSDVTETVLIKGGKDGPVRVNKADFDADQASDKPKMTAHTADDAEQSIPGSAGAPTSFPPNVPVTAAPSAPDFTGGGQVDPPLIDQNKNAVAPTAPSENARLVASKGTGSKQRFYAVNGDGTPLLMDGIDQDGYKTDAEAWEAIMKLPR